MANKSKCNEQKDPNGKSPNNHPRQQQKVQAPGFQVGVGTVKTKPKRGSKGGKTSTLTKITDYTTYGAKAPKIKKSKPAPKAPANNNPTGAAGDERGATEASTTGPLENST